MNTTSLDSVLSSPAVRLAAALVLCAAAAPQARAASVVLCAEAYTQTLGGNAVPMWGYRKVNAASDCDAPGTPSSPGPQLDIGAGDTSLTVTLVNKLTVPTSIVIAGQALPAGMAPVHATDVVDLPGSTVCTPNAADLSTDGARAAFQACRVRSFTGEAAPGATQVYQFNNLRPGSYLYQSGTHPQVQIQMGLFGLVAKDAPTGDGSRALFAQPQGGFDADVSAVLSEVDPELHARVAATLGSADPTSWQAGKNSTLDYNPRFFLVNGRVFDGSGATDLPVMAIPGARVVLRMANAGLRTRVLMLTQGQWQLLTEDGSPYPAAQEQYSAMLAAGKTRDAVLIADPPSTGAARLPLFDRRGGTFNGDAAGLGGQVAQLLISGPSGPTLLPIAAQVANEGSSMALQVKSFNITGFSLAGQPAGMTIGPTGLIAWPVPLGTAVPTAYDVTVNGSDGSTTVSRSFNVRVNHTPLMSSGPAPVNVSHGTVTLAAATLLAAASDPDGDTLAAQVTAPPAPSGTLTANANGSLTYSGPQPGTGTTAVTFSYAARDPFGLASSPAVTVTLNVAANVAPVAATDTATLTTAKFFGIPLPVSQQPVLTRQVSTLTANDSDADGSINAGAMAYVAASARRVQPASPVGCSAQTPVPAGCLVSLPGTQREAAVAVNGDGSFTFTPRIPNTNIAAAQIPVLGTYEFRYTAFDDQGKASNVAVVRFTVN